MPRFANYDIEALLGRGGMAEVYRGRVIEGARAGWPVAIKRLIPERNADPLCVQLFLSEGELSRHLRHPNVVEVYEAGAAAGTSFIAMELVEGRDLAQIMARVRELNLLLPVDFACFLVASVALGLHHAHEARGSDGAPLGIVHCDISPSNVFVSRTGEIKLGDFGVARANRGPDVEGGAFGKLGYISPEQLRGDDVAPAADIFALGLVLYELLTGERAFPGDSPKAVLKKMKKPPRPPSELRPGVSAELDDAVLGALEPELKKRTRSAAALAEQLRGSYDDRIGTPMAIAAVVRGLFEPRAAAARPPTRARPATRAHRAANEATRPPTQLAHASVAPKLAPPEPLMPLLGALHRERASATVFLEDEGVSRELYVREGKLCAARSNVPDESLGALLLAERRADRATLERLAAQSKGGRDLAAALLEAKVVTGPELTALLEKQTLAVLNGAVRAGGDARRLPLKPVLAVCQRPLATAVIDASRAGVLERVAKWPPRATLAPGAEELGLRPAELRAARQLASGIAPGDPALVRVLSALVELGFARLAK